MNIQHALQLIASFSAANSTKMQAFAFAGSDDNQATAKQFVQSLEQDQVQLPSDVTDYIQTACPTQGLSLEAVGHPVELLASKQLSWQPEMLAQLSGELAKWDSDWLMIAHEGGDPIIVKASEQGGLSTVYSAMQGMGFWDFAPIADSIGQFLVCVCAIEHALNFPGLGQPLDEDFNLAPAAANWLFPFLRQHAGAHYDEWASVFENYQ
jgi:hypothetical protein